MTHTPQSGDTSGPAYPCPAGDEPSRMFETTSPSPATMKPSRTPLILLVLSVVIVAAGLMFCGGGEPDTVEAVQAVPDVSSMTAEQLAEDAGLLAAKELTRRMFEGTPAEQAAASSVVTRSRNPRLARHMVMALEHQTKQQKMMRQMDQNRRTMERRHYGMDPGR